MIETGSQHIQACPTRRWGDLPRWMFPRGWMEQFRASQQLPSCCRSPENLMITAYFSDADEAKAGRVNVYKMVCTEVHDLGDNHPGDLRFGPAVHPRFMCGSGERPTWS